MNLLHAHGADIYANLALEDWLLDHGADFAPLLLFTVNDPCVVIGKNQVPWRECATGRLRAEKIPMARRVSGGGTVFHDNGCLNYSFILPRETYKQDEVPALIIRALRKFGIVAEPGPNNGLFVGSRKFSGTAYCYRRQHVLHHGTLLVNSDLEALRRFCKPALPQIETRAIASRPASVVNLAELAPGLSTQVLADALAREAGADRPLTISSPEIAARADELRGWDFLWGHTPKFEFPITEFRFVIEQGRITAAPFPELVGENFDHESLDSKNFPALGKEAVVLFQSLDALDF